MQAIAKVESTSSAQNVLEMNFSSSHTSSVRSNYSELLNVIAQCNIQAIAKVESTSSARRMLEMESTYSTFTLSHILGSLKLLRIAQFDCKFQHPSSNPPQTAQDSFK